MGHNEGTRDVEIQLGYLLYYYNYYMGSNTFISTL